MRAVKPHLNKYLDDQLRQKAVGTILRANPKLKRIVLRNYNNKWKNQVHKLQMKNFRDNVFDGM